MRGFIISGVIVAIICFFLVIAYTDEYLYLISGTSGWVKTPYNSAKIVIAESISVKKNKNNSSDHKLNKNDKEKFLSHRLRGFDTFDLTLSALKKAISSQIKYLEIDVRASNDGILYIFHDPCTGKDTSEAICFKKTNSEYINKVFYKNGEKILALEEALKVFKSKKGINQILCIDIKDYGYEINYINLIRKYELEKSVIFITWIPQTILELNKLGAKTPFILSHFNFTDYLWITGNIITNLFKNCKINMFEFVILGKNRYNDSLTNIDKGYQHCLFIQEIPPELEIILSSSEGGICIPKNMANKKLLDYCFNKNIKVWIFSVDSIEEFEEYSSNRQIDVIFCNFAI